MLTLAQTFPRSSMSNPMQSMHRATFFLTATFCSSAEYSQNICDQFLILELHAFGECSLFLPSTQAHTEQMQRSTRSTANLGCCLLGAIENKDKGISNCCTIFCLILLGSYCICLKVILVVIFYNMGINKCLGFLKDTQENILQQQSALQQK